MGAGAWVALSLENPKSQSQVCLGAVVPDSGPISPTSEMTKLISKCPKTRATLPPGGYGVGGSDSVF